MSRRARQKECEELEIDNGLNRKNEMILYEEYLLKQLLTMECEAEKLIFFFPIVVF